MTTRVPRVDATGHRYCSLCGESMRFVPSSYDKTTGGVAMVRWQCGRFDGMFHDCLDAQIVSGLEPGTIEGTYTNSPLVNAAKGIVNA